MSEMKFIDQPNGECRKCSCSLAEANDNVNCHCSMADLTNPICIMKCLLIALENSSIYQQGEE